MQNKNTAFTLVELIVVITILAILWTIWFISFQNFSSEARDSKRISDLVTVSKALDIELITKEKISIPDNKMDIYYSGTLLWYQWDLSKNILNRLNIFNEVNDPVSWNDYLYRVNPRLNEYQLSTSLESSELNSWIINKTYANDNINKILSKWDKLWIFLESNNLTPLHYNLETLDTSNISNNYYLHFNKNHYLYWSWSKLLPWILWWGISWYWNFDDFETWDSSILDNSWNNIESKIEWNVTSTGWVHWNWLYFSWSWTKVVFENLPDLWSSNWSPHTISAWVKPVTVPECDTNSCRQWILLLWEPWAWSHHWLIWWIDWPVQFWIWEWQQKAPTIIPMEWQFLTMVYDWNKINSYRNWELENKDSDESKFTKMNIKNANLTLWLLNSHYYEWYIDSVSVFNKALSHDEVKVIYDISNK